MFGNQQISWLGPLAAATVAFAAAAAFRSSDLMGDVVTQWILGPIQEILRLSW